MIPSLELEMNLFLCSNHARETYICRVNYPLFLDENDVKTYNGGESVIVPCVNFVHLGSYVNLNKKWKIFCPKQLIPPIGNI